MEICKHNLDVEVDECIQCNYENGYITDDGDNHA
jgi:hypothetical protein